MNHEPSQFYGPPKREGATLNVPLPQSATLSDMCVNGPIVYECLDSVLRSQVHLLQRNAPTGHHPLPLVGGARSPAARVACAREWTDELCAWLRAWLGVCKTGWERMQRNSITTSEEKQNCNNEVSKGFRKRNSAFEREADPQNPERKNFGNEKKKSSSSQGFFFCFELLLS